MQKGYWGGGVYFRVLRKYVYVSKAVEGQLLRELGMMDEQPEERIEYLCCEDVNAKWWRRIREHLERLARNRPEEFEQRFVLFDFRGDEARRELVSLLVDFCSIATTRVTKWRLLTPDSDPIDLYLSDLGFAQYLTGGAPIRTGDMRRLLDSRSNPYRRFGHFLLGGDALILRADVSLLLGHARPLVWAPIVCSQVARVHGRLEEFIIEMRAGKAIPPDTVGRPGTALRHALIVSRRGGVGIVDPVFQAFGWRSAATLVYAPADKHPEEPGET